MAFDNTKLSYFHSFSKMPVEANITLGNAINKSGHTVTASEVWANDIPYYGKMAKLSDVVDKVQPYARKNDMCYITTGDDAGKTFQYDGEGNWVDITSNLVNGYVIKNSKDEDVLLYHKGVELTYLTDKNNANTDSKDTSGKYNASRLWATIAKDGTGLADGETRLVEQFAGPTDKALNGLASVAYAPSITIGGTLKTAGTDYYDYCFSGTILWASGQSSTTVTKIDCFEYVGEKVSDVVDTVATQGATIKTHTNDISEIKATLGMSGGGDDSTPSVTERVETLEEAVETLNGTGDGSVSKAVQAGVTEAKGYTDTEIAKIKTGVQSVTKSGSSDLLTISGTDTDVTIELSDTVATKAYAEGQATAAQTAAEATAAGALSAAKTELEGKISAAETAAETALSGAKSELQGSIDGVAGRVTAAEGKITTLEGQVTALTEGESSVASQIAAAKTELEGKITKAQGDAEATAKGYTDAEIDKVEKSISDALEAHTKDIETINTAINGLTTTGLTREIKTSLTEITEPAANVIYLVPDEKAEAGTYIEYLYVNGTFEAIGSTETDLSDYAKTAEVTETLKGYTTTGTHEALAARVTTAEGTIAANTAAAAAAQAAADKAQGEVDALEGTVGTLAQTVADNKTAADAAIALKADQTALDATNVTVDEHTTAISTLNTTTIPGITGRLDAIEATSIEVVASTAADQYITVDSETKDGKTTYTVGTTGVLETRLDTLEAFIGGGSDPDTPGLSELLAKKVDNVTGGDHGITISTADTDDGRVATLIVSADTEVTAESTNVVTSGAVQAAIETAQSTLQGEIDKKVAQTAYDTKVGEIEAAIATKASAADHTALASRVTTAEGEIDALQAFMNGGAAELIQAHIDLLDGTPSDAGIQVTQANGILTDIKVTAGKVEANDASVVTGGIVYTAISEAIEASEEKATETYAVKGTETVAANAAAAAKAADDKAVAAQADVDALEVVVSTLSQTHTSDKAALEASIAAVSAKIGDDSVATQIDDAIKALDVAEKTTNGITYSQTDGKVAISVTADTNVTQNSTNVVTSGAVYAAVANATATAGAAVTAVQQLAQAAQAAADAAQTTAEAKVETITTSDDRITLTPTITDKVKSVAITLADTVATTGTDGTVYTKDEIDTKVGEINEAITAAKPTSYIKSITAGGESTSGEVDLVISPRSKVRYLGSPLFEASLANGGKALMLSHDPAKEWNAEPAHNVMTMGVSSVINGKMDNDMLMDDANLVDNFVGGVGLFEDRTITTFIGNLGKLTNGTNMFKNSGLTTFIADLGSLENGTDMFTGCSLTLESIMYIADSLPEVSEGTISLGTLPEGSDELIAEIEGKGWDVA